MLVFKTQAVIEAINLLYVRIFIFHSYPLQVNFMERNIKSCRKVSLEIVKILDCFKLVQSRACHCKMLKAKVNSLFYCSTSGVVNVTDDVICPRGYYCPMGTKRANELPCPRGTFGNSTGLEEEGDCTPCTGEICQFLLRYLERWIF